MSTHRACTGRDPRPSRPCPLASIKQCPYSLRGQEAPAPRVLVQQGRGAAAAEVAYVCARQAAGAASRAARRRRTFLDLCRVTTSSPCARAGLRFARRPSPHLAARCRMATAWAASQRPSARASSGIVRGCGGGGVGGAAAFASACAGPPLENAHDHGPSTAHALASTPLAAHLTSASATRPTHKLDLAYLRVERLGRAYFRASWAPREALQQRHPDLGWTRSLTSREEVLAAGQGRHRTIAAWASAASCVREIR